MSCGGEYDPLKCMIKGYWPPHKVPDAYIEKLRNWAATNNVRFGKPSDDVKTEPAKSDGGGHGVRPVQHFLELCQRSLGGRLRHYSMHIDR